jgi:hypothetical protein
MPYLPSRDGSVLGTSQVGTIPFLRQRFARAATQLNERLGGRSHARLCRSLQSTIDPEGAVKKLGQEACTEGVARPRRVEHRHGRGLESDALPGRRPDENTGWTERESHDAVVLEKGVDDGCRILGGAGGEEAPFVEIREDADLAHRDVDRLARTNGGGAGDQPEPSTTATS